MKVYTLNFLIKTKNKRKQKGSLCLCTGDELKLTHFHYINPISRCFLVLKNLQNKANWSYIFICRVSKLSDIQSIFVCKPPFPNNLYWKNDKLKINKTKFRRFSAIKKSLGYFVTWLHFTSMKYKENCIWLRLWIGMFFSTIFHFLKIKTQRNAFRDCEPNCENAENNILKIDSMLLSLKTSQRHFPHFHFLQCFSSILSIFLQLKQSCFALLLFELIYRQQIII